MIALILSLIVSAAQPPCPDGQCPLPPPPTVAVTAKPTQTVTAGPAAEPTVIKVNGESWCLMPGDNWIVGREFTVTGPAGSAKMLLWYSPAKKAVFLTPDWKVLTP